MGSVPETQEVMTAFYGLQGWELLVPALFGVLIQPFCEELLFRSFLQPLLVQNFREVGGVLITSLIFGAMHGLSVAGPTFVLSLIMGGVMQRTQRFSACFCVHALHNGMTIFLITHYDEAREFADVGGWLKLF
jgi:membrane protease YdiL (CAAX protease family)